MKEKLKNNKKLRNSLIIAMLLVIILLGGTYAWLRIGLSGSNTNKIKAGMLDLIIDESPTDGAEVRLERAIPQSYRQGLTNKLYRFTIVNNSTIETDYTLSLNDYYVGADASLTSNQKIADNLIRYILVKNNEELVASNSKLLSTGRTIETGTIAGKSGNVPTTVSYTLYMWIDSMAGENGQEADIMNKIFNARLGITAEQHHAQATANIGDIVLYNPVTLESCNNVSESNCYEWIVLSKDSNNQMKDLLYLRDSQDLLVSSNPFTTLETYTANWNSNLSVDSSYDLPSSQGPPFAGYSFTKARFPQSSEITNDIINVLKTNNVVNSNSEPYSKMLTSYDTYLMGTVGNSLYYDYDEETEEDIEVVDFVNSPVGPYGSSYVSNEYNSYYVHPVISIASTVATCSLASFQVGDYISMTPSESSYQIPGSLTGYGQNQEIDPSELTLWRVINVNNNGSLDIISDNISSTGIYFSGTLGYKNYVGTLNTIASHYENSTYTIGSRYMGYDGQTEYIGDISLFDGTITPASIVQNTPKPTTGVGQEYMSISSGDIGDTLYLKDYQLVYNVYGNLRSNIVGTDTIGMYYLASRAVGNEGNSFYGRIINPSLADSLGPLHVSSLRFYDSTNGWMDKGSNESFGIRLRPIVVLNSGLSVSGGSGTSARPYVLCQQ